MDRIQQTFANIPVQDLLRVANRARDRISIDRTAVRCKSGGEVVTAADTELEALVLEYFAGSPLAGTYLARSEEGGLSPIALTPEYVLLLDPLDGTSAFLEGKETWGIMIGLCNLQGELIFSWNAVSNGQTFSSETARERNLPDPGQEILSLDLFDYGSSLQSRFVQTYGSEFPGLRITCSPSAVWAGWQLFTGELDSLLWLASENGKRHFPDYDLIFLGALAGQGWKVALGIDDGEVAAVVVAPTLLLQTRLVEIASALSQRPFTVRTDLRITEPYQP